MMKIYFIWMLILPFGCKSTENYSDNRKPSETESNNEKLLENQLIEVIDVATGEKTMRPMSDYFELVDIENAPKVKRRGKPNLPKGFKGRIEAVVSIVVSTDGTPKDIEIVSINRSEFSEYALNFASSTKFKPASHRGELVEVRIEMPFEIDP